MKATAPKRAPDGATGLRCRIVVATARRSKFAGIVGPLVFGLTSQLMGQSRLSILILIVFFVVGGLVLTRVDVAAGIAAARTADTGVRLDCQS